METRHKRKAPAHQQESKPGSKRSKRGQGARREQTDQEQTNPASAKPAPEGRLTRAASKALGQGPLSAQAEPERLLKHTQKRRSPSKSKDEPPAMAERGVGGSGPGEGLDDDDYGRTASAMEGLLRRLGAGLGGVFGGPGSSRVRAILSQLRDEGDEMAQLAGLTELCEYLSISTEESLMAFPTEQVVPLLVGLVGMEHNPDIMLLAARALTFLADVYPPACGSIIRHGAVPAFCARLLTIEFIDLAEQSLQALEKLSHDHPGSLLRHGGLVAVLSFLDFFPTGVQRTAVATAANMCRALTAENADAVATAAPILIGLLQYQDAKLVDTACLALTRIAEAFSKIPSQMEMLCGFGLITSIAQMVRVEESGSMSSQLSVPTFYGLLKLLATCASGSHVVAESLLQAGISGTLRNLLATSALFNASGASPGNVLRSTDQLGDLVALTAQLLPPIPDAAAAVLQDLPVAGERSRGEKKEAKQAEEEEACQRTKFLRQRPELLQRFTSELLPPLLKVYSSSVTPTVKRQCLSSIAKMLTFNDAETLRALTQDLPVSSFVAALLRAKDATVAAFGMQLAEILMVKLPDVYGQYFLKEGVVHAMDQLTSAPAQAPAVQLAGEEQAGASGESSGKRSTRSSNLRRSKSGGATEPSAPGAAALAAREAGEAGPSSSKASGDDALRSALAARAKRFKERYFTDAVGNAIGCDTEGVKMLTGICQRLPDPAAVEALMEALAGTGNASVSTFELLSSGTVKALRKYLQGADLGGADVAGAGASPLPLLQRLSQFAAIALPPGSGTTPPLAVLVSKVLGALAASESFAVQMTPIRAPPPGMYDYYGRGGGLSRSLSGPSTSLAAGLAALSNPLKVRLVRSSDDTTVRDFNNGVVMIDALATISQLEEFLWPRVCPATSAAAAAAANARDDSRSRQAQPPGAAAGAATSPAAAGAASVNNAAAAAAKGRGSGSAGAPAPPEAEAAALRPTSRNRPIPTGRRMTRAQARAAAEAEVVANSMEEARPAVASPPTDASEPDKRAGRDEGMDIMSDDAEDVVIGAEEEDSEEDIHTDEDMDDAGYVEGDGYDDEGDDLGVGSLSVHDMHLDEIPLAAAVAAAAAAAEKARASSRQSARGGQQQSQGRGHNHQRQAGTSTHPAQTGPGPAQQQQQQQQQTYAQATGAGAISTGAAQGTAQQQQQRHHSHHHGHHQQQQQPEPHLAFYLGGKLLGTGATIFQAVQRHMESKGSSRDVGSIWSDVHTLSYRPFAAARRLQETEAATSIIHPAATGDMRRAKSAAELESCAHDHDSIACSPLRALLPAEHAGEDGSESPNGDGLAAPQDALDCLAVLRTLEALNRLTPHLQSYLDGRQGTARPAAAPALGHVPRDVFVSSKLAPKLGQQLKDVISICGGSLPSWCQPLVVGYKFLFPFEARRRFFYCTSFGLARALTYLQQVHAAEHGPGSAAERESRELRGGRLQRQKVRISRRHLLESALKVFETYAGPKSQLEIEYFGEVGTGLGPTLEFYTLLSHELQRKSLGLWRHTEVLGSEEPAAPTSRPVKGRLPRSAAAEAAVATIKAGVAGQLAAPGGAPGPLAGELPPPAADVDGSEAVQSADLVRAPQGLFPAPLAPAERSPSSQAVRYFGLLGKVTAKALQDGRLLDLPLSPVFYRLALGGRVDLYDIRKFDAGLGASVEKLHAACHAHLGAGRKGPLLVDGCPVEDLCLAFVLPGYPQFELAANGSEVIVTAGNIREYIDAVVDATLGTGVSTQVDAFREGFNQIFPLDSLQYFYEDEIEAILCGTGERWSVEQLQDSIKFDHGYTSQSTAVRHFLEVLAELDALDQRRFLRFVTGSPRLPPGGLAALQPRLTVVRKLSAAAAGDAAAGTSAPGGSLASLGISGASAPPGTSAPIRSLVDGDLPSVMTCVNYIKLPPYSSKEVARERLLFAIREGQGSFDLS